MLQAISVYLVKTIIVSAVLLIYYWLALRNKRFHYYNRFYLLSAVVFSIAVPFINLNLFTFSSNSDHAISLFNVMYAERAEELATTVHQSWLNWQQFVLLASLVITILMLSLFIRRIVTIYLIKRKYPVNNMQEFDFINTDLQQAPFSFLRNIFWRNDISLEEKTGRLILQHELSHIKQKHTWDKLFMQMVTAILWANPLYKLIQKELYLVHEFIADDKSVTDKDMSVFAEMLLHAHYGKFNFSPAQPFFYSPIKRRLIMLTTSKEHRFSYARRIMALPLLACVVLLFAFRLQNKNNEAVTALKPGTTFKLVVDAGHGGEDFGAIASNGTKEKDITLAIARKIKELSSEYKIDVAMTRQSDEFWHPAERTELSAKQHADAFVSIHVNAKDITKSLDDAAGMEIMISKENKHFDDSKILGSAILQKLGSNFKINENLLQGKTAIWVLKENTSPAILLECGYINNAKDLNTLTDNAQLEQIARNVLEGVVAYANHETVTTSDFMQHRSISDTNKPSDSPLYILDGKEIDERVMKVIDPDKIESVNVLKGKTATDKYGEKGKNGVIEIFSKDRKETSPGNVKPLAASENKSRIGVKAAPDSVLYVVDGIIAPAEEYKKIDPTAIISVNVLKGKTATDKYGDKGTNGVIEISTNKQSKKEN